ncbi:MAG: DUF1571 domain-containing protein [Phycisphaerae bacterium]|nr:DUF1571 domain-containing protein [Phycisphaerae bacterium]
MKKTLLKIIRPTNRGVRVLVGLLLVALLCLQMTIAKDENEASGLVKVDASTSAQIQHFAETDHVALLEMCLERFRERNAKSYTCTFVKQEKIRGRLGKRQTIDVKFLAKPFSVAMRWVKNPPKGDMILYVEGKFKDDKTGRSQMVVRPTHVLLRGFTGGSVKRLPDGDDAKKSTLRPCTMFGFENSLKSLLDVYKLARQRGECVERMKGFSKVDGRDCIVLVRFLPERKGYPAKKTIVCIDLKYLLPVRVQGYGWDDKVNCDYEYQKVNFDVALQAKDFTPKAVGFKTK